MAEPLGQPDFTTRLSQAIESYEASWKPVDSELYELGVGDPATATSRMSIPRAVTGLVYEAGVARAWRGQGDPSRPSVVLLENATLIQSSLDRLAGRPFDRQSAAEIVELHGHIAGAISHRTNGVFLASFVSKLDSVGNLGRCGLADGSP
jgi:hypothetical protein